MAYAIKKGSDYFNTITWTADASNGSRSFTGVNFSPDFVWTKGRTLGWNHLLYDSVRGVGAEKELSSQNANAEGAAEAGEYGYISSLDTDGFTFTDGTDATYPDGNFNYSPPSAYVAWNWKAGGTAVSNTDGDITTLVSANPTAGFSIVTFTGTDTITDTIGHGLGTAPEMIILRGRSIGSGWFTYHTAMGNGKFMYLDTTQAETTSSGVWNNTSPTSEVFVTGAKNAGVTAVAYCFASVEGYSKFGSYTGNGSADGPFVYTGFRPAYLMVKRTNSTGSWFIQDTTRNPNNVSGDFLLTDTSGAEAAGSGTWDNLSNGFKLRTTSAAVNASGGAYIYMAFAETPFKYANAR